MSSSPHVITATVTEEQAGQRLDKWLSAQLGNLSRNRVQQLIVAGHLTCHENKVCDASYKIKANDRFQLTIPKAEPAELVATPMPLSIVYEDEDVIVIDKPAGLAVHPAPGHVDDTLVNGLLAHCPDSLSGIGGIERPGIVHRLDKDTSGLMVIAKHDQAHQHLSTQLQHRTLRRIYTAIVWGVPSPSHGVVDAPIGRSRHDRKKMAVVSQGGKDARTHYHVENILTLPVKQGHIPAASVITCQLETGRTHQIRVHLTHMGHGLIGDPVYGASTASRLKGKKIASSSISEIIHHFPRQALHAKNIAFTHPKTSQSLTFSSDVAEDMRLLMDAFSVD